MGKLYDAKAAIDAAIKKRGLDSPKVCGQICLKAGLLLALVKPDSPDDPVKLAKLKSAAKDVLGLTI